MTTILYPNPALDRLEQSIADATTMLNLVDAGLAVIDAMIAGRPDVYHPDCYASCCDARRAAIVQGAYTAVPCPTCDGWKLVAAQEVLRAA